MAQNKFPAKCSECGLAGPQRKEAAIAGWIRKYGKQPDWLCPEHGKVWKHKEDLRMKESLRLKSKILAKHAPLLGLAMRAGLRVRGL